MARDVRRYILERADAAGQRGPCEPRGVVSATLARLAKSEPHAHAPRQVDGLTAEALAAIQAVACQPRQHARRRESADAADKRGRVDIALCCLLSDAGLRRSEAAALTWADISREPDGSGRDGGACRDAPRRARRGGRVRAASRHAGAPGQGGGAGGWPRVGVQRAFRARRVCATDDGRRRADRGGPAPGPLEVASDGEPLHARRSGRGRAQVPLTRQGQAALPLAADAPGGRASTRRRRRGLRVRDAGRGGQAGSSRRRHGPRAEPVPAVQYPVAGSGPAPGWGADTAATVAGPGWRFA